MSLIAWLVLMLACLGLSIYSSIHWNRRGAFGLAVGYAVVTFALAYCVGDIVSRMGRW